MAPPPRPDSAQRVVASWDPAFRQTLLVRPEEADDPQALARAAARLPEPARDLLGLLLLVTRPGDPLPDRLRPLVEAGGDDLWRMAALLTRPPAMIGATVHPTRYAGACRLNPALAGVPLPGAPRWRTEDAASYPPSDARWDAIVMAATLEARPVQLTVDGGMRRDAERRLWQLLGNDEVRWRLALEVARLGGLVRPVGGRLVGFPDTPARRIVDVSALCTDPFAGAFAALLVRVAAAEARRDHAGTGGGSPWIDLEAWLGYLRAHARTIVCTPQGGSYPGGVTPFDDTGWAMIEAPMARLAADVLHRAGFLDAVRAPDGGIRAVRAPVPQPERAGGVMVLPDNEVLVPCGEIDPEDYGRLARMAPYVEGVRMHRHRLSREGVSADISAGHPDPEAFLARISRTGVPPTVADSLREWQRAATQLVVRTGVDILEDDAGTFRVIPHGTAPAGARSIDYALPPRARFLADAAAPATDDGATARLRVPEGWDPLTLRALIARVAREVGMEGTDRLYAPELRAHADPEPLLVALRTAFGGELPGELETLVRAGTRPAPITGVPALLVRLPETLAAALRRDRVAGPLLRRAVNETESLVPQEDVPALRARLASLGLRWEG